MLAPRAGAGSVYPPRGPRAVRDWREAVRDAGGGWNIQVSGMVSLGVVPCLHVEVNSSI